VRRSTANWAQKNLRCTNHGEQQSEGWLTNLSDHFDESNHVAIADKKIIFS
jgi:hypothetical protein